MKKLAAILCTMFLLVAASMNAATSTPQLQQEIQKAVELSNAHCPMLLDARNDVTLQKISYVDNTVIYDYSVATIDSGITEDDFKKVMILMLKQEYKSAPETQAFFDNVIKVGGQLRYHYVARSGQSFDITITNSELKKAVK